MATILTPKGKQYVAMYHGGESGFGPASLESLRKDIEESGSDVDDFTFYEVLEQVEVKLEKKLTLVEA